ncbi:hypothetical protein AVEN_12665-1 [Araneus ventricosus]|uniref:Uncharacterized protein n=1 Tax=Araneus ventricosus TaxID=182803 RepID=A0A4Y2ACG2_ARAVE|nr:hypothetical protein AVEN_12665-1 [Araneus ventricosus]
MIYFSKKHPSVNEKASVYMRAKYFDVLNENLFSVEEFSNVKSIKYKNMQRLICKPSVSTHSMIFKCRFILIIVLDKHPLVKFCLSGLLALCQAQSNCQGFQSCAQPTTLAVKQATKMQEERA